MERSDGELRGDTPVFVGVDTHSEEHVAVALDGAGGEDGVAKLEGGVCASVQAGVGPIVKRPRLLCGIGAAAHRVFLRST